MIQTFFIDGVLPGLNEVLAAAVKRRGKWNAYNDLKSSYGDYIATVIRKAKLRPVQRANISFTWVEQSQRRDKDNVRTAAKFVLDALVATKILPNDGWKQIGMLTDCYEVDTKRPGVRVEMIEIYEDAIGTIPEGKHIDHLCGVRYCVNPNHLEAKDWADKLVAQKLPSLVFPVNIANLLRQERRATKRRCRKLQRETTGITPSW